MSKESAGKKTQAKTTADPGPVTAVEAAATPAAEAATKPAAENAATPTTEGEGSAKWWAALAGAPVKVWGAIARAATKSWAAVSGASAKAWTAVAGAASRLWGALRGAATKVKATGQRALAACADWWTRRSKRGKIGLISAGASVIVAVGLAVFLFLFLRPVFVVEALEMADAVVSGEDVVLSVDVTNGGRTAGEYELCALVDGEKVQTESVRLEAGAEQHVSLRLAGLPAGSYDVELSGWPEQAKTVWVMTPAKFEMGRVRVRPNPMNISASNEAEVSVRVANLGEATGSYKLEVSLDGVVVETREVEVKGGDSTSELFTVKVAQPGSSVVTVNGESAEFEIYRLGRPATGSRIAQVRSGQYNTLKIKNLGDLDCVVVLKDTNPDRPAFLAVYVRAHSECSERGVLSGTYECYYSFGEDWCTYRNEFTENEWCRKFDELMTFKEGGPTYTIFTLELGGGSGRVSNTSDVGADDFPDF